MDTGNWLNGCISSYPGQSWHWITTKQDFVIRKGVETSWNEKINEKCVCIDIVPANLLFTTSEKVVEHHTLFLQISQVIIRKQLAPAQDD